MSESSELRKKLRSLPRTTRLEIAQAVMGGRAVADPTFASIAVEFARTQRRTLRRGQFIGLLLGAVVAFGAIWLSGRHEREQTPGVVIAIAVLIGVIVGALVSWRIISRIKRAEVLNRALVTHDDAVTSFGATADASPDEQDDAALAIRLVWASIALWSAWWLVGWIASGAQQVGIITALLPTIVAFNHWSNPRQGLGWRTGVLMFVHAVFVVDDLTPPFDVWNVVSGLISIPGFGLAVAARYQSREFRRLQRERHIALGGDPPFVRRTWRWFRARSMWAQIGIAVLVAPFPGLIVAGVVAAIVEAITKD